MAKIYSDEEIEQLSRNPHVLHVSRNQLSLALPYRQRLYDGWIQNPVPSTIRRMLEQDGFDTKSLGANFYKNIGTVFKKCGRPKRMKSPAYNAEGTAYGAAYGEMQEPSPPSPKDSGDGRCPECSSLLDTGKFIRSGSGIWFSPDFEDELFSAYPDVAVEQGIQNAGVDLQAVGYQRIYRLKKIFSSARRIGTDLEGIRRKGCALPEQKVEELRKNPFVEEAMPEKVRLGPLFFEAAASLGMLRADEILDVFLIDHSALSLDEKAGMMERLSQTEPVPVGDVFRDGTVRDACILRRREAALKRLAEEGWERIAGILPTLTHVQKKRLCLWMEGLPKDPAHEYTKRESMRRIGISKSVYYLYVGDESFGLGDVRKKEEDSRDAGLVRMAFEYKGFRKGSRQIYMLLPRIAGRRISLKKIRRLMKECGLDCGIRGPNMARRQARARETGAVKPNLLRRTFRLHRPNEVRVTDVTYLTYGAGLRAYGSALMDPVTGRLLAFVISENNDLEMALETLRAMDSHPCRDGGIFHSDQGVLYKTESFQKELLDRGLRQSMSKRGNCWDNATQESFFGHFKDECPYASCKTIEELEKRVAEYSYYYDNERGLWDRGRMTPAEYEVYLLSLSEEDFGRYLAQEEEKYKKMKERAAELAKKRYGTLGV